MERICEGCGGRKFYAVTVGEGARTREDYVPLVRRYGRAVAFEVRALACERCGLVQHVIPDSEIVRSRRDIKDFFFKNLPPNRDRNRVMEKLYRFLDNIEGGFDKRFRGRNIREVFAEIVEAIGVGMEVFRCGRRLKT